MRNEIITVLSLIDNYAAWFDALADQIWEHPELSLKEFEAAKLYCNALRELGFSVTENLCGIQTAFCGSYGHGRPVIGILGEFDALSGLSQKAGVAERCPIIPGGEGHGCGHNLLGAGSLMAAAAVKRYLEDTNTEGTVVFFGCPGEEGGSGKAYMARDGYWKTLDAALSWHPSDANQVRTGTNNSCIQVLYHFHGIAAHAASDPHNGRSALDAVELMNIGVQFLREHMKEDCRIHYSITDAGGVSPNVVQENASVLYMVRANKVMDTVALQARVDDIARGAALMTETSFERVFIDGTSELVPNYTIERALHRNMTEIGLPQYTAEEISFVEALKKTYQGSGLTGIYAMRDPRLAEELMCLSDNGKKPINDFIVPQFSDTVFFPGSTDVGDVSWQTPITQLETVCWPAGIPGHSWQVVACGKSSFAHKGMHFAAKVLAATAIDLITDEALLLQAKKEFNQKNAEGYVCPIEPGAVPISL